MFEKLDNVRHTNKPALLLGVEYAVLERDERNLKQIAERDGLDRFLKADITTNQKGREAVGGALEALEFQVENSALYHAVMVLGSPRKIFDRQNLVVDIVRDAARTQANNLRNDMKGLVQTDLERKRRAFLERRHQNMVVCENMYTSMQKEARTGMTP